MEVVTDTYPRRASPAIPTWGLSPSHSALASESRQSSSATYRSSTVPTYYSPASTSTGPSQLPASRVASPAPIPYRPSPRPNLTRSSILIGIDFGTTYSGVSWAKSSGRNGNIDPQSIHVVTDWPGGEDNSAKVPTRIQYSASGSYQCGYEIPGGADALKWFKLLLMKEEDIPSYLHDSGHINKIDEARTRLTRERKDVVQVIADYLRFLWTNTVASIEQSEESAVVNATPYVVVLTFPALWKSDAIQRMRDAAALAGILDPRRRATVTPTVLHTVEEPEAAALATYADLRENHAAFRVCRMPTFARDRH
jgi:molecular chaperone DnaK (HSP70)